MTRPQESFLGERCIYLHQSFVDANSSDISELSTDNCVNATDDMTVYVEYLLLIYLLSIFV